MTDALTYFQTQIMLSKANVLLKNLFKRVLASHVYLEPFWKLFWRHFSLYIINMLGKFLILKFVLFDW